MQWKTTFDFASMNLTPLYDTERMMIGILRMLSDDFWQIQHNKQNGNSIYYNKQQMHSDK